MSVGIEPTTVMQAAPWVAEIMSFDWPSQRKETMSVLNSIRNHIYNRYEEFKLFDNVFHCICVSTFPMKCGVACPDEPCYQGITLPPDVAAIESAWIYGRPLKLRSRWRESHLGLDTSHLPRIELVEMAERFVTERELKSVSPVKFYTDREEDSGKTVTMEVHDGLGETETIRFELKAEEWTISPDCVSRIVNIVLPGDLHGPLILAQEDGYELSVYSPHERVPVYKRYRIASASCPASVAVQGTKKYQPVWFDHDIVEIGDKLVIEHAARYIKFADSAESSDQRRSERERAMMDEQIRGLMARHRGNAIQDNNPFRGRPITRRSSLPGYEWR